jgi:hypothetical protein
VSVLTGTIKGIRILYYYFYFEPKSKSEKEEKEARPINSIQNFILEVGIG